MSNAIAGNSALLNVGTTAGSVAAGDDARIAYGYRNYAAQAANAIDSLLAGKTASFTNLAGTGTQNFFSTYNGTTHAFARNPACIYPWPSYVSCWNSANADGTGGNRGCVTMVTPTQGLTNNHFSQPYQAGVVHYFLGTDGMAYPLTVASAVQIGTTDTQLVTFTAAAPAAVGVASVLATGVPAQILPVGTPLLSTNQQKQAVILEFVADAGGTVSAQAATASNRMAWTANPPAITGDSDSPCFALVDGQLVLLTTWHYGSNPSSGPSFSANLAAINAALAGGTALKVQTINLLGNSAYLTASAAPTAGQLVQVPTGGVLPSNILPAASAPLDLTYAASPGGTAPNYTVSAGQYVSIPLTSANATIALPATPPNGTKVSVGIAAYSTAGYTLTITKDSADYFADGVSTLTLTQPAQRVTLVYGLTTGGSGKNWTVLANTLSPGVADARYVTLRNGTITLPVGNTLAFARASDGVTSITIDAFGNLVATNGTIETTGVSIRGYSGGTLGIAANGSLRFGSANNNYGAGASDTGISRYGIGNVSIDGSTPGDHQGTLVARYLIALDTVSAMGITASGGDYGDGFFAVDPRSGFAYMGDSNGDCNNVFLSVDDPGNQITASGDFLLTGVANFYRPCQIASFTLSGLPNNTSGAYHGFTATVSNPATGKSSLVTGSANHWLYQDGSIAA